VASDVGTPPVPSRCVVHPSRRAVDDCPVCGRARCAADATEWDVRGCAACGAQPRPRRGAPPSTVELAVRGGLAGLVVAVLGGFVATQYVDTRYFAVVAPGLVGLAAAWAVTAAARPWAARQRVAPLVVASAAALLGTGLGFRLVPGGQSLVGPAGEVGPPYLAAVVGVLAWPLVFAPPSRTRRAHPDGRGIDS
jgi:hypothetical protein